MSASIKNVIVVGGSYVGCAAAKELAAALPATHRVLLVEPHSHFNHLFAFPRFAVHPSHEHKAFIPYTRLFHDPSIPDPSIHQILQAKVVKVAGDHVELDRQTSLGDIVPFEFLAIATGCRLPSPGSMTADDKVSSVAELSKINQQVIRSKSIIIVGGGAVGIQMATDIKELYPGKDVTLIHSRDKVMPKFHPALHDLIQTRFDELGIHLILNNRVTIPSGNESQDGKVALQLADGRTVAADMLIQATGQIPNNQLVQSLPASEPLINPANGFIRVLPTLQLADAAYPNIFSLGDIADTGSHKAAKPGGGQAKVLAQNIVSMINGREPEAKIEIWPPGIHMTLGIKQNVVFRNPQNGEEPMYKLKDDGKIDMNMEGVWTRRNGRAPGSEAEYHL